MPITTGLGEIYQYVLTVDSAHQGKYSNADLRTIQDWVAEQSGVVSAVTVNKGQYITSETLLMQMASDDHLHLELKVFDANARNVALGQNVLFNTSNTQEQYTAKVVHINPVLDEKDGGLIVHCHFDKNKNIKAGMYVTATINGKENKLLSLPQAAAIKEGNEYFAYEIIGEKVVKTTLTDVVKSGQWISSKKIQAPDSKWITEGAYYVE